MGTDFIDKAARSFRKAWDNGLLQLGRADLFRGLALSTRRLATFESIEGFRAATGDRLIIEVEGDGLVASKGFAVVARCTHVPDDLLDALAERGGIAEGVVEEVYEMSGMVDVSLC